MRMFATLATRTSLTLFTVIIFFNMNLFLAEVEALDLLDDKQMMQNIAKLIAGVASEEEKDFAGGSSEEENVFREIDFIQSHDHLFRFQTADLSASTFWLAGPAALLTRSQDAIHQPPEA